MLNEYLNFLHEQTFGVQPPRPVQNPQGPMRKSMKRLQPKVPTAPKNPTSPKEAERTAKRDIAKERARTSQKQQYFNYMLWTTNILKQGEIFRKNCYNDNCGSYEIGTGERRVCKDRCDVEACKKIVQMLRVSIEKCKYSKTPDQCKVRFMQLIPLYQEKQNQISKKFLKAERSQNKVKYQIG